MSTGIFTFAEELATALTSEESRAAADGDRFRTEAWDACLPLVTDENLRGILREAGWRQLRTDFAGVLSLVLADFATSEDLPHILIALSLLHGGYNPSFMAGWVENCES